MRSLPIVCLLLFGSFHSSGQSAPQALTKSPPPDKETATVAGNVLRLDTGEPLKKARVTLNSRGSNALYIFYLTDEQGRFAFENVPPGSYDLQVSRNGYVDAQYGQKKPGSPGAMLTLTSGQRMTDLVFKLVRSAAISGHVFDEDAEPIARAAVMTYRASIRQGREQENVQESTLKLDGTFLLKSVREGPYRPVVLLFAPEKTFYLKSARYGTTSITDAGFTVQPGSDASLELTLSPRAAKITGMVLNADSLPAVGATVVLIPDLPHRDLRYRYISATTDQKGKFSLTAITPGDYKLFSWDSVEQSDEQYGEDWFDSDWLKPYETKGESVHLEEADQKSVTLNLIETVSD